MNLHWQMNALLFGLMLLVMAIVCGIGYVEGLIKGHRDAAADWPVAPMLLCPRCGPDTEPFSHRADEQMAARGRHQIGRLNLWSPASFTKEPCPAAA